MFKKRLVLWLVIIVALLPAVVVMAQGAPVQMDAALADLSNRVGTTVTLSSLSNWLWSQETYPDTSLGCPQDGVTYAQVQTVGYQFLLTYAGTVYDYRVSADSATVILCSQTSETEATSIPEPADAYTNPLCPLPEAGEPNYMRSQLVAGIQGQVTPGAVNNVRAEPAREAALSGQIPGGAIFSVQGGPRCADGLIWWYVDYDGLLGWTAEGENGEYWLQPVSAAPLPQNRALITVDNAFELQELSRLEGNFAGQIDWSQDSATLAIVGGLGSSSLWLYDMATLDQPPRIVSGDDTYISVDLHPAGGQALLGASDGAVHFWNLTEGATLVETLFLQSHQRDANVVAFHPDGQRFVVAGTSALTTANVEKSNAILLWDTQTVAQTAVFAGMHTGAVEDMDFNINGTRLASVSESGLVMWDVEAGTALYSVATSSPARSIAFSGNSQFIAVGTQNGTVDLIEASTGNRIATYVGHTGDVNAVAFSPDSTLLASTGGDGSIRVWSTQADNALIVIQQDSIGVDLAFSPDNSLLAVADQNNRVRLFGVRATAG